MAHSTQGWVLGSVVKQEADGITVRLEDGSEMKVPEAKVVPFSPEALEDHDDLCKMNDLTEPALFHNLRMRYNSNNIYVSSYLRSQNNLLRLTAA